MRIFLSYARHDRPRVADISRELELLGFSSWFDSRVTGGQRWWDSILDTIRTADIVIACISEHSLASRPCQAELQYAAALRRQLLPLVLVGDDLSSRLPAFLQQVQAVAYPSNALEHRAALAAALRGMPTAPALPAPLPDPPPMPLSVLAQLAQRLQAHVIDGNEQMEIFEALHDLYHSRETSADARYLLRMLRSHEAVLNVIAVRIDLVLQIAPGAIHRTNVTTLHEARRLISKGDWSAIAALAGSGFVAASSEGELIRIGSTSELKGKIAELEPREIVVHPTLAVALIAGAKDIVLRSQLGTRDGRGNPYDYRVGGAAAISLESLEPLRTIETYVPGTHASEERAGSLLSSQSGPTGQIKYGGAQYRCCAVARDGELFAIGSDDGRCLLWDLRGQVPIGWLTDDKTDTVRAIRFSASGEFVFAADYAGWIRVWRLADRNLVGRWSAHAKPITALAVGDGDDWLASASRDGTIALWRGHSGERIATLEGDGSGITSIALLPAEALMACGTRSGELRIWDIKTRQCLHTVINGLPMINALG